ncbi:MAG TPA: hypothetical protein VI893_03800 [Thermoplasmata archaeon]|nr:hypothetical protein [Thermoplasmata archaeon]
MNTGMTRASRAGMLMVAMLFAGLAGPGSFVASAHDMIKVGEYTVKWGWNREPACVNQENAVWMEITKPVNGTATPVNGAEKTLKVTLIGPGGEKRDDELGPGEENGTYVGKPVIPTSTGTYLLKLEQDILGTPVDETVKMDFVLGNNCIDFPPSKTQEGKDAEARKAAAAAWAQSNATAAQVQMLTLLVYAAGGVGGASLALAGYNAHLGRQSLAIARQKESREKGEEAADELLKTEEEPVAEGPKKA